MNGSSQQYNVHASTQHQHLISFPQLYRVCTTLCNVCPLLSYSYIFWTFGPQEGPATASCGSHLNAWMSFRRPSWSRILARRTFPSSISCRAVSNEHGSSISKDTCNSICAP